MASCIIDGFICGYNIAALKSTKSHCVVIFKKLGWQDSFWSSISCPPWSSFWTLQKYFFFKNNLRLYEFMYKTVEVISSLKLIYIFPLCEIQYNFFAIFGTTLWDYINKKTGRVKGHCQLASTQMSNYQSTVGTEIAPFFISLAFKQHC